MLDLLILMSHIFQLLFNSVDFRSKFFFFIVIFLVCRGVWVLLLLILVWGGDLFPVLFWFWF